jgi:hypothetical protein
MLGHRIAGGRDEHCGLAAAVAVGVGHAIQSGAARTVAHDQQRRAVELETLAVGHLGGHDLFAVRPAVAVPIEQPHDGPSLAREHQSSLRIERDREHRPAAGGGVDLLDAEPGRHGERCRGRRRRLGPHLQPKGSSHQEAEKGRALDHRDSFVCARV